MAKEVQLVKKATQDMVGKSVLVFGIGDVPIDGIINTIDTITGFILTVIIKDENKQDKVLEVKDKVVVSIKEVVEAIPVAKGLWAKLVKIWFRFFAKK